MKFRNPLFLFLIPTLFIFSCKKSSSTSKVTDTTAVDVYVVGTTTNSDGYNVATYWKNGKINVLNLTDIYSWAVGIAVVGNDVYVAGYTQNQNFQEWAVYWKNDVEYDLETPTTGIASFTNSIVAQGTDVYISGTLNEPGVTYAGNRSFPTIWKNGIASTLTNADLSVTGGTMTFNGSDMYVAAQSDSNSPEMIDAEYFKNGVEEPVQITGYNYSSINSIAIQDNDVYLAGSGEKDSIQMPVYWKNGIPTTLILNSGYTEGTATGIAFHGSDMYVTGNSFMNNEKNSTATLWKNGLPTELDNGSSSLASAIFIQGNDVYVAGEDAEGGAAYWKNGQIVELAKPANGISIATSILVVPRQ